MRMSAKTWLAMIVAVYCADFTREGDRKYVHQGKLLGPRDNYPALLGNHRALATHPVRGYCRCSIGRRPWRDRWRGRGGL